MDDDWSGPLHRKLWSGDSQPAFYTHRNPPGRDSRGKKSRGRQQDPAKMPSIKGTSSVADARERSKTLKSTKFPAHFSKKVKLGKINLPVMTQWIEQKITTLLGMEDEIVSLTAVNLFLPTDGSTPDPKRAQLDLVGFLGEAEAAMFATELWALMVEAQEGTSGIPRTLLEEKKKEIAQQKLQRQGPPPPEQNGNLGGMNRIVDEAHRRAAEARHMLPPAVAQRSVGGPVPIPHSPDREDASDQPRDEGPDPLDHRNKRKRDSSRERDRKMPPHGGNERPRSDGPPPPSRYPSGPPPPPYRDGPGHLPPPRGRRDPGTHHRNSRDQSLERGMPGRFGPPPNEDEFHRTNNWRREGPQDPHPPPPRHPDERGRWEEDRGRRRYSSEVEEMEELERRLLALKNRAGKRGENKVLDDEIDKIEDRLYDLDRHRRRRLREEEEFRRRKRDDRQHPRSRSMERRGGPPAKSPSPEGPIRGRSDSEDSRSVSSRSSDTSRSSSSGSSRSSVSSYHRRRRRPARSRSRSSDSSSRSSSPGDRRR